MLARAASTSSSYSIAVLLKLSQMGSVAKAPEVQLLAATAVVVAAAVTQELRAQEVGFTQISGAVQLQ